MITSEQLAKHAQWVANPSTGERLESSYSDLREANLSGANLFGANLSEANLSEANLSEANLIGANLIGANLFGANLSRANLSGADLRGAHLIGADLRGANLIGANLSRADLRGAHLIGADLFGANLIGANLIGADLRGADLIGAKLSGATGLAIASDAPERLQAVAKTILNDTDALNMETWHTCETTHCLAGWAIHQAGELGRLLEASVGPHMAGLQLLGVEAAEHFYDSNEDVLAWLETIK